MRNTRIAVTGMTCGHCKETVERALRGQAGVHSATVNLEAGTADVEYEEREIGPEQLIAAVTAEGYPATFAESASGGG